MDEAKDYKAYLKALKEMTKGKSKPSSLKKSYKKVYGPFPTIKKFSCGGMGIAIKGGNFKGVK